MQKIKEHGDHVIQTNLTSDPSRSSTSCTESSLNPDDYRQDLASFDLTEDQKKELLEALWQIMATLVNIGWGVDTVQSLLPELFGETLASNDNTKKGKANG